MARFSTQRRALIFGAILALAALPRVWAAVWDQGIFWPDEIFQSLEPAHHFAFGYGFVAWEFQDGARSWLFPGVLGLFWKVLASLGVSSGATLVIAAKLSMVGLALVGIYAAMRIAEILAGAEAAVLCGVLSAAFPPSIVYGSRAMTEMASGPLCAVAALLTFDRNRRTLALAGGVAALAIFLRYQNGVIAVGLFGWLLAQRRVGDGLAYAAGAAIVGLAGGLLDLVTWGAPFHSFVAYVRFNLVEGRSADFGVAPLGYYVAVSWTAVGIALPVLLVGLGASARRATGLAVIVFVYVLLHTIVPHKEFRFMMPIAPLLLALSSVGLVALFEAIVVPARPAGRARAAGAPRAAGRRTRRAPPTAAGSEVGFRVRGPIWALAGVLALAMAWRAARATFDDFGQSNGPFSGPHSVWHAAESINRLLWAAGEQPDLCGLALIAIGPIWTGGFTYLHRDVPFIWESIDTAVAPPSLGAVAAAANYILTAATVALPADYATITTLGEAKLARRPGACAPPAAEYSRLFPK